MKSSFFASTLVLSAVLSLPLPALAGGGIKLGRPSGGSVGASFSRPAPRAQVPMPRPSVSPRPTLGSSGGATPLRGSLPAAGARTIGRSGPAAGALPIPAAGKKAGPSLGAAPRPTMEAGQLADLRKRIENGTVAGAADTRRSLPVDSIRAGRGGLTGLPTTGRREFGSDPAAATGTTSAQNLIGNRLLGADQLRRSDVADALRPDSRNHEPPLGTGTVVGQEREPVAGGGNAGNQDGPPLGTGTVVGEEREPITPPAEEGQPGQPVEEQPVDCPPAEGEPAAGDAQQPPASDVQDAVSVIDAISNLIGTVGSVGPPPYHDGGYVPPVDGGIPADAVPIEVPVVETAEPAAFEAADKKNVTTDIELVAVRLVEMGNLEQKSGPRLRLFYRNLGTSEVAKFHITVAVDAGNELTDKAEKVTVESVGLRPGQSQTIDVRLPVETLTMRQTKSGPAPFSLLVAWIDSSEEFDEAEEENNLLVLSRDKIEPLEK